jgi:hypothetical protein
MNGIIVELKRHNQTYLKRFNFAMQLSLDALPTPCDDDGHRER